MAHTFVLALALLLSISTGAYAADLDEDAVVEAATLAGVTVEDLKGALYSTGESDPKTYLYGTGELARPEPERGIFDLLANCESGGNWAANTHNGYYGGIQFDEQTWHAYGGVGLPHQASRATQIAIGEKTHAARGWQPWPRCRMLLGLP